MPRVVPSQVVSVIDTFVSAEPQIKRENPKFAVNFHSSKAFATILELVRRIPEELLVLDAEDFTKLLCAQAAIETTINSKRGEGHVRYDDLTPVSGFGNLNPIFLLRDALAKCPDEYPSKATSALLFIDLGYRDVLRLDISAVNQALSQGEWKAATVLAGSVVEALLLWAIKKKPQAEVATVISALVVAKTLGKTPPSDLDWWNLSQFMEVALALNLIVDSTAQQVRLAKDFRNLIHPGRSIREKQECNRGTALSAVSAVEHVVTDLTQRFLPIP
jgi:hypothetical protein